MKYEFDKNNLESLALILEIDIDTLRLLYNRQILDARRCLGILVKFEYVQELSSKPGHRGNILRRLARKYKISESAAQNIVYNKNTNKPVMCSICKSKISKYKFAKNGGCCDICTPKMKTN